MLIDIIPLVQQWVSGVTPNNGIEVAMTTTTGAVFFDSKETIVFSHHPELQIALSGPAGPPGTARISLSKGLHFLVPTLMS